MIPLQESPTVPHNPLRVKEHQWLKATCAYECFDEHIMPDTDWDKLGAELHERRIEWSPYFAHSIPGGIAGDFNPGTTGSGLDWAKGLPRLFYGGLVLTYGRDPLGLLG